MKTKLPLLFITGLVAVGPITSCGPKSNRSSDPNEITVAIVSDTAEEETLNNFIKNYLALPGNEGKSITMVKMTNYDDYIEDSFLYDDLADIIQVYDYNCEYYANANIDGAGTSLLQPISSYMARDGIQESDFYDSIIEMTKCKTGSNEVYWAPRDYNKVVCAYNKKIFDIAELDYPSDDWTWTDFVNTCNALNDKADVIKNQYTHLSTFYPVDLNLTFTAVYYPILKSYGVDLVDKTTRTCFGNTPEALETAKSAWDKLLSLVDNKLSAPPAGDKVPFTNKQAGMMFIVRPNLPTYVHSLGEDAIDFVSLPTYDDNGTNKSYIGMGCSGYGITTACPDSKKDFAWDFLKYIISEKGQNDFSEAGSGIPCLRKLASDPNAAFKQYMSNAHPNHDAFIAHEDRDIPMNFLKGFETNKQRTITKFIKDRALEQFYKSKNRDQYFADFKRGMEEIWN